MPPIFTSKLCKKQNSMRKRRNVFGTVPPVFPPKTVEKQGGMLAFFCISSTSKLSVFSSMLVSFSLPHVFVYQGQLSMCLCINHSYPCLCIKHSYPCIKHSYPDVGVYLYIQTSIYVYIYISDYYCLRLGCCLYIG